MSEDSVTTPRWDKIDNLFARFDAVLDDAFTKDNLNFLEVQITMLMVSEKLQEEKFRVYSAYLSAESVEKNKNFDIYR